MTEDEASFTGMDAGARSSTRLHLWFQKNVQVGDKVLQMLNQQAQFPTTAPLSGVTRWSVIAGTFLQSLSWWYFLFILLSSDDYLHQS